MNDRNVFREAALAALPRIMFCEITSSAKLVHAVEDLALSVGDDLEKARLEKDPHWWTHQDRLDDILGILDYVKALP